MVENNNYNQLNDNPWTYVSKEKVKILKKIVIEDIYLELRKQYEFKNININFYNSQSKEYKENVKEIVKEYMRNKNIVNAENPFYIFVKKHFEDLL